MKDCDRSEYSRQRRKGRLAIGLCAVCGQSPFTDGKTTCEECRNKIYPRDRGNRRKYHENWMNKTRKAIFAHYGSECRCCGESNPLFLTLDHINNDGYEKRKATKSNATRQHSWHQAIVDGYPDDLQILCYNCNLGKARNNGVCPHQTDTTRNSDETNSH